MKHHYYQTKDQPSGLLRIYNRWPEGHHLVTLRVRLRWSAIEFRNCPRCPWRTNRHFVVVILCPECQWAHVPPEPIPILEL